MTCRIVQIKSKEESIQVQLIAFYLGYSWTGQNERIRSYLLEGVDNHFLFYSLGGNGKSICNKSQYITRSDRYLPKSSRSHEDTVLLTIEEFSKLTKEEI